MPITRGHHHHCLSEGECCHPSEASTCDEHLLGVHGLSFPSAHEFILEMNTVFVVSCSSSQVGQGMSDIDLNKEE